MNKMIEWDFLLNFTEQVSFLGRKHKEVPPIHHVEVFESFFNENGEIKKDELSKRDGKFTRREIITRYLLVNVVLDQGPDIIGVRNLIKDVTTELYRQEIRIFHRPLDFFKELGISIDEILAIHEKIKKSRASLWAKQNKTQTTKYNLFFAQSLRGIISINQVLDYAIHRWGVPLCVPLLLERDLEKENKISEEPLVDYIESFDYAETMANQLKNHERYGLGSAIGDKACHLFVKMYISRFNLVRKNSPGWNDLSYELPFDSNAGRVLFRTGFLLNLVTKDHLKQWEIIREGTGKRGTNYLRITNLRNKTINIFDEQKVKYYKEFFKKHFGKRFQKVKLQHIPNILLYQLLEDRGIHFSVADFDDGLIYIGTKFCLNHDHPKCDQCPVNSICMGYNQDKSLITDYTT